MTAPHWKPRTLAAQALGTIDPVTQAVVPPLHMSTTFIRDPDNQYRSGYCYGRARQRHGTADRKPARGPGRRP